MTSNSDRKRAYDCLVVAGTNALCVAGMSLDYETVSAEQKVALTMTEEEGYVTTFDIDGVPCVAVSKPAGAGEERIVVVYDSNDVSAALSTVRCAGTLPHKTAAKFTLERKRGPYIMESHRLYRFHFRVTNPDKLSLSKHTLLPNGYTLDGPFIF